MATLAKNLNDLLKALDKATENIAAAMQSLKGADEALGLLDTCSISPKPAPKRRGRRTNAERAAEMAKTTTNVAPETIAATPVTHPTDGRTWDGTGAKPIWVATLELQGGNTEPVGVPPEKKGGETASDIPF